MGVIDACILAWWLARLWRLRLIDVGMNSPATATPMHTDG
jgi:hypothetical protein